MSRGWGILVGLLVLPIVTIFGFGALWRWETTAVLLGVQIVRKAMHYAVDRPTREVLYTVLGPDAKYKSKSFIDAFVYRSGDVIGIWTSSLLNQAAIAVSVVGIGVAGVWAGSGAVLAAMQRRVAARAEVERTVHSAGSSAGR
jgi:AAA family ATP:ADP antiporter